MEVLRDAEAAGLRDRMRWDLLFLEHLEEFSRLAWYLVADDRLVESVVLRTMTALDSIPFDVSLPELTYNQARETIIQQSVALLRLEDDGRDVMFLSPQPNLGELAKLPRLAFMLKLILRSPDASVAKLLEVTPSRVRELVQDAINSLSQRAPDSLLTGCFDA
jgi:DNA-directed RNA polymerase specialized sigma24 family protein